MDMMDKSVFAWHGQYVHLRSDIATESDVGSYNLKPYKVRRIPLVQVVSLDKTEKTLEKMNSKHV
jgi:hypothetical protein